MNLTSAQDVFLRMKQHKSNWWIGTGLPGVLVLLLLIAIASQLASLSWLLLDSTPDVAVPVSQPGNTRQNVAQTTVNWDSLKLFGNESGTPTQKPVKKAPRVTNQQDSQILKRLNVKLVGVVASSEAENSWIAVSDGGSVDIYNTGDEIRDGVIIEEIRAKEVTLRRGDVTEVIAMAEGDVSSSRPRIPQTRVSASEQSASGTFRVTSEAAKKRIEGYQQALKTDPLSLFGKVRTIAVLRNDKVYGQRLRPGNDRTLLRDVGLRSGDILLSINGIDVNDAANAGSIIESMAAGQESFQLKIERGGKVRDMRIELR
jgi:general secretion pathway protein C